MANMNFLKKTLIVFTTMLLLSGCNEEKETTDTQISLPGEETVLATVNGSTITEYELDLAINKTFGAGNASKIGEEGRKKVLKGLAASRAISQAFEKGISPETEAEVNKKVQAYREQILVQKYIAENVTPEPVTQEMVKEYYEKYPERFGAKIEKKYEMISTTRPLKYKERDLFLSSLIKPETKKDWANQVKKLKAKKLPVFYKKGNAVKGLLHKDLDTIIDELKKGETSKLRFIDERPYVIRIIGAVNIDPRPLTEVGAQIRTKLGPVQLKKAVKQVSAEVLKTAKVDYSERE